jgi:hypothetical protein
MDCERHLWLMSTLAEIESAADQLPREQMEGLLLHIVQRLRQSRATQPEPRDLPRETLQSWIAEDEADMEGYARHG